jgi:pre-rRNA-processing protein IPI1
VKIEQSFQDLNLIYCELTSLLVLASYTRSSNKSPATRRKPLQITQTSEGVLSLQAGRVSEYVIQLLRGEASSGSQLGRSLAPAAYTALLPTIWWLLNQPSTNQHQISGGVLQSLLEHATNTSSNSAVKKLGIEFIARLILVSLSALSPIFLLQSKPFTRQLETEVQYQGSFRMARSADEVKKFEDWLLHLPKVLWELGSNNLSTIEAILRFLLRLFQRKSCLIHQEVKHFYAHPRHWLMFSATDHSISAFAFSPIFHHHPSIPRTTPWPIHKAARFFHFTETCSRPRCDHVDSLTRRETE